MIPREMGLSDAGDVVHRRSKKVPFIAGSMGRTIVPHTFSELQRSRKG
jgi:hypothetical protein